MPAHVGSIVRATAMDAHRHRQVQFPWPPYGVSVLVFVHAHCASCDAYVRDLETHGQRFRDWGSTVWIAHRDPIPEPTGERRAGVRDVVDPTGALHAAAQVNKDHAAIVVLDVHGEVYFARDVTDHTFPDFDELFQEARFPALQCPECETPDVPSQTQLPS